MVVKEQCVLMASSIHYSPFIVVREKIIEGDFRGEYETLNDEVMFLSVS